MKSANLKSKLQNLVSQRRFYPFLAAFIVTAIVFGGSVFLFLNFVKSLDETLNKPIMELPPLGVGIDFNSVDKIALKLGIEIPARNIPSKYLARNEAPKIFNFTSIRPRVLPREDITIFLNAYDPEGDTMQVDWSSNGGTITPIGPYGPARWKAPKTPGDYVIEVSVSDNRPDHRPATASINIKVLPQPIGEISAQDIPAIATALVGLVKEEGEKELYLAKYDRGKFYKRLLIDEKVIDFYSQLTLNDVQTVPDGTLDGYILSDWIRGKDRTAVYKLNPDGVKQHYKMSWEDFVTKFGGSDAAVFTVNDEEVNYYRTGIDITP